MRRPKTIVAAEERLAAAMAAAREAREAVVLAKAHLAVAEQRVARQRARRLMARQLTTELRASIGQQWLDMGPAAHDAIDDAIDAAIEHELPALPCDPVTTTELLPDGVAYRYSRREAIAPGVLVVRETTPGGDPLWRHDGRRFSLDTSLREAGVPLGLGCGGSRLVDAIAATLPGDAQRPPLLARWHPWLCSIVVIDAEDVFLRPDGGAWRHARFDGQSLGQGLHPWLDFEAAIVLVPGKHLLDVTRHPMRPAIRLGPTSALPPGMKSLRVTPPTTTDPRTRT